MLRILRREALEIGPRLLRIAAQQIMIAGIVEERRGWRSRSQQLPVNALRGLAVLFGIETSGLPKRIALSRRLQ